MSDRPERPDGSNGRRARRMRTDIADVPLSVKCPTCRKRVPWEGNPWRPFCSERCEVTDRGRWAAEEYAIPAQESTPDDQSEGE